MFQRGEDVIGNTEQVAAFTLFDGIRELLAEAKILDSLVHQLSGLLKANDLNTAGADSHTQYTLFVSKINANLASGTKQVSDTFTSLLATLKEHPELDAHDDNDDAGYLSTMQIEWSSALKDCTQLVSEQPSSQAVPLLTTSILNALADLIKRGELLTFPDLVNKKLSDMQTGQTLNFFTEYANEFTNQADLQQVWEYLKSNPLRINGVMVDPGLIINELKIIWSIITIWVAFLISTFLGYGNDCFR